MPDADNKGNNFETSSADGVMLLDTVASVKRYLNHNPLLKWFKKMNHCEQRVLVDFKEIGIELAQDMIKWPTHVNALRNLWVP